MELYFILALMQGFILGWILHRVLINYKIHKVLKEIAKRHNISMEDMIEEVSREPKIIRVPYLFTEAVDNSIMLFNKETKQFICQATNLEDLAKNLMNYNKIKLAVVAHNDENLWFVDGKVKKDFKETE